MSRKRQGRSVQYQIVDKNGTSTTYVARDVAKLTPALVVPPGIRVLVELRCTGGHHLGSLVDDMIPGRVPVVVVSSDALRLSPRFMLARDGLRHTVVDIQSGTYGALGPAVPSFDLRCDRCGSSFTLTAEAVRRARPRRRRSSGADGGRPARLTLPRVMVGY